MTIRVEDGCTGVDWNGVQGILKRVGMGYHAPGIHQKAFEASYATVFLYDGSQLIGFGRAISDGAYQAAIYDCAVHPDFQGKGLGKKIIEALMAQVSHCNVILYASPGKEGFYRKYGFRRMKTGMACFRNPNAMAERGFTE